jgi:hypothetical protein
MLIILAASLSALATLVHGAPPPDVPVQSYIDPGHAHVEGEGPGQEQIIESVQSRYHGRRALKLRLMSAQRVWTMVVDASTGRVLSGG